MLSYRGRTKQSTMNTIKFAEPVVSRPIISDSVSIGFSVVFRKRVELLFKTLVVMSLTLMNKVKVIKTRNEFIALKKDMRKSMIDLRINFTNDKLFSLYFAFIHSLKA